ncbi:hypothetical protein GGR53DRAFT_525483 [Hypoxylon sp. FL1150]|nr:hypothetical protein GGR53DRAFT_525483 [Hypoxylon sp. FL1150]
MPLGGKGPLTIAILMVEVVLAGGFIAMRLYTRKFLKGGVGADDYLLMITWVLQFLFTVLMIVSSAYGFGQHNTDINADDLRKAMEVELIGQFFISIAMGLSKVAVAAFLMRIIVARWHKAVLWFWIVTMMAWSLLLAISCFAQCAPVEAIWDARIENKTCPINLTDIAFVMCSWSAAMDFFLAAFPWVVLWKLNMPKKEKITICLSLSLGVVAGICGIVRTSGLKVLSEAADYLYATADSIIWTNSEMTITIMCASIPVIRPLWTKMLGGSSSAADRWYYKQSDKPSEGSSGIVTIGRWRKERKTDTTNTDADFDLETVPRPDVTSTKTTTIGTFGGDADSENGILRNSQMIQQRREFTIDYHGGRDLEA